MNVGFSVRLTRLLPTILLVLLPPIWWPVTTHAHTGDESGRSTPTQRGGEEYRTPLAGAPFHTTFLGNGVNMPRRDRSRELAVTLGGTVFSPPEDDNIGVPIAALYWRRDTADGRVRLVTSVVCNELDLARGFGRVELLGRFESATNPFPQTEITNNRELTSTSLVWGTVSTFLGVGLRYPVAPYQTDNDLRLQALARIGYFYDRRTGDTGADMLLPPDTALFGLRLRGRYDGFRRNLLELPHSGLAAGFDVDLVRRDRWSDTSSGGALSRRDDTRDYLTFSAYLMAATGIPGTSERNRLLLSLHGGAASKRSIDRFNAFRLGGGPFPDETDDLYRPAYPGSAYNEIPMASYLLTTLEYRREILFFLYGHLRATLFWAQRPVFTDPQRDFRHDSGHAFSCALTTGFFWGSRLYLEYAWDTGFLRNGTAGSSVMLLWTLSLD